MILCRNALLSNSMQLFRLTAFGNKKPPPKMFVIFTKCSGRKIEKCREKKGLKCLKITPYWKGTQNVGMKGKQNDFVALRWYGKNKCHMEMWQWQCGKPSCCPLSTGHNSIELVTSWKMCWGSDNWMNAKQNMCSIMDALHIEQICAPASFLMDVIGVGIAPGWRE